MLLAVFPPMAKGNLQATLSTPDCTEFLPNKRHGLSDDVVLVRANNIKLIKLSMKEKKHDNFKVL